LDIVNISTLAAIKPFVNWGVYCATKAGRDMISQVIKEEAALEQVLCHNISLCSFFLIDPPSLQNPDRVKTLNYAPGPLDTDMQTIIRATDDHVPQRDAFRKMHDEGTLIKPDVSAGKLIALLVSRTFQSGSHVDFYDI
jgi:sepiapterin reductase